MSLGRLPKKSAQTLSADADTPVYMTFCNIVGGVSSPLLSNIMLNEFDRWLEAKYLTNKARKDRWYWNNSIKRQRPIALRENRQWLPAVAYCRYADDFVVIVKGNKAHAEVI